MIFLGSVLACNWDLHLRKFNFHIAGLLSGTEMEQRWSPSKYIDSCLYLRVFHSEIIIRQIKEKLSFGQICSTTCYLSNICLCHMSGSSRAPADTAVSLWTSWTTPGWRRTLRGRKRLSGRKESLLSHSTPTTEQRSLLSAPFSRVLWRGLLQDGHHYR